MNELRISSIPMMELTLHAFEALSVDLKIAMPFIHDSGSRSSMKEEIKKADEMIAHIEQVIKNAKS